MAPGLPAPEPGGSVGQAAEPPAQVPTMIMIPWDRYDFQRTVSPIERGTPGSARCAATVGTVRALFTGDGRGFPRKRVGS